MSWLTPLCLALGSHPGKSALLFISVGMKQGSRWTAQQCLWTHTSHISLTLPGELLLWSLSGQQVQIRLPTAWSHSEHDFSTSEGWTHGTNAINVLRAFRKDSVTLTQMIFKMTIMGHSAKLSSGPEESSQQIDISDCKTKPSEHNIEHIDWINTEKLLYYSSMAGKSDKVLRTYNPTVSFLHSFLLSI